MGTVYKARHRELDRLLALKILPPGRFRDEQAIARFRGEMRALGRLRHPNLVLAHDAGEVEGIWFVAMELVEGLSLAEVARRCGSLRFPDACELIRQASVGLQYAHERGLVHRDIKPSNLMLTNLPASSPSPEEGGGVVKILDFGLALSATGRPGEAMTHPGVRMGTPDYMAPEQFADSHVDSRADIYALGCTLYTLLAGRPPFSGPEHEGPFQKLRAHLQEQPPDLGVLRPDLPAALVAVVARMLAKAPEDRYATSGEVAAAIAPFAAGCDLVRLLTEPEAAKAGPSPAAAADGLALHDERQATTPLAGVMGLLWALIRRHRVLATTLGLILLCLSGVIIWANRTPPSMTEPSEAQARPTEPKVIRPWHIGSDPEPYAPAEPPPGTEPLYTHEDVHQFLVKTIKPLYTPMLRRRLYSEIATTIDRAEPSRTTWTIGSAWTSDGNAYEFVVCPTLETPGAATAAASDRNGWFHRNGWCFRIVPLPEAKRKGIEPDAAELRVVQDPHGARTLKGRVRCVARSQQWLDHLALVIDCPLPDQDATSTLYVHYRLNEVPSGWLAVEREVASHVNLKHGARIRLQALLARPQAGFFRISNELLLVGTP